MRHIRDVALFDSKTNENSHFILIFRAPLLGTNYLHCAKISARSYRALSIQNPRQNFQEVETGAKMGKFRLCAKLRKPEFYKIHFHRFARRFSGKRWLLHAPLRHQTGGWLFQSKLTGRRRFLSAAVMWRKFQTILNMNSDKKDTSTYNSTMSGL